VSYYVRLIGYDKNFSASPRPRVSASALTISIQPDMISLVISKLKGI